MRSVLAELLGLLRLERLENTLFRGQSQDLGWGAVFGGQVLGQALSAAQQTVPGERQVHSFHGYFLRSGDVRRPIIYDVECIRDGKSFTTRRVVAIQNGQAIFSMSASFQAREPGFDASVGGPPADPQTFANFLGALAREYCGSSLKAIEVWNEQNLHYEWGNMALDPAAYVNLLRPAYAAIKAACPSMWVVSGALTPAGNNGSFAIDDFTYLEGMFQNGVANLSLIHISEPTRPY